MKVIMLALKDYENHTTDEGWQIQEGLRLAGVDLWGKGYTNGETHVPTILKATAPDVVILSDPRDWDPSMGGAYDKTSGFTGIEHLFTHPCVLPLYKDAGACPDYQRRYHHAIGANGWISYYHPRSILPLSPWIDPDRIIRTYHTIDRQAIPEVDWPRIGTIISGARNARVYPLRERILNQSEYFGVHVRKHPGYGNDGSDVASYYRSLCPHRVSIATASGYGFALRKILEGVACGCTVLTDLPEYDEWPGVSMIRIRATWPASQILHAIRAAEDGYNPAYAEAAASKAIERYDYRVETRRLYRAIEEYWRETTGQ